jgi:hypothetical protein
MPSRKNVPQSHADVMMAWAIDPPTLSWIDRFWFTLIGMM